MTTEPYLYLVRCNFTGSAQDEARWNDWYSGPKMADMLRMPLFVSGRRYRSTGLDQDVRYLAIWQLRSPEALQSERYRRRWGFAEWADRVGDWSRDLAQVTAGPPLWETPAATPIVVTAFDDDYGVDQQVLPGALWCKVIGLDHTWPWVAIEHSSAAAPQEQLAAPVAWRTRYEPLDGGDRP